MSVEFPVTDDDPAVVEFKKFQETAGCNVQGWMRHLESAILMRCFQCLPDGGRVLIVGLYTGAQICLAKLVRPDLDCIGADNFSNTTSWINEGVRLEDQCWQNLRNAGIADNITIINEDSQTLGPRWDKYVDFCLIDADHDEVPAYNDLHNFAKWVNVGGYLAVDDMNSDSQVRKSYARWIDEDAAAGRAWEVVVRWPDEDRVNKCWLLRRTA